MIVPPAANREDQRLAELADAGILDTPSEAMFDDLVMVASQVCGTPISLVGFVDRRRWWCKAGMGIDLPATDRDSSFCAHTILQPDRLLVVPDARRDVRFVDNPLVTGSGIRFYAGAPLTTASGLALGALCVMDRKPRILTAEGQAALGALARQVMSLIELHSTVREVERSAAERQRYADLLEVYQRRLEHHIDSISEETRTDPLTGLRNRRAFIDRLEEEVQRSHRTGRALALAFIDVDFFKSYNDEFGHLAGDAVLRRMGELFRRSTRATDFVARYGGEEFAVILPDTDAEGAIVLGERLRRAVERETWPDRQVTVSVGVATVGQGDDPSTLLGAADAALYEAKTGGRNRIRLTGTLAA